MIVIRYLLLCIILGLTIVRVQAQDSLRKVLYIDSREPQLFKEVQNKTFSNEYLARDFIQDLVDKLHKKGYLEAAADSWQVQTDTIRTYIHTGPVYTIGKISLHDIPRVILNNTGIIERDYTNKVLSAQRIGNLMEQILVYVENNGYPFAQTYLDSIQLDSTQVLHAVLRLNKGPYITIDSIRLSGNAQVDRLFLQSYLGIKEGKPYNEKAVRNISKKIQELPFLQEAQPWVMNFTIDRNNLDLYLNDKKSNQINALVGLQPNSESSRRFTWTADILLLLNNTMGYGETFNITYKNLQVRSPQLNAGLIVPYIMGSNIAVDAKFEYFGRDTLFRRTAYEAGLRYLFTSKDYIRIAFQLYNNRVANPDIAFVQQYKTLNDNIDINTRGLNVEYVMNRTNHIQNPVRGWAAQISMAALQRKVLPNDNILSINDGFDYNTLYEAANKDKVQYRALASLQYFIPLAKLLTIKTGYEGGYISGQNLYQNELYQIGGFKLLRGFDERSIYANQYHVFTAELRTLLSPQSYFFVFADGGKTYTRYNLTNKTSTLLSFGTGISLESKSGIFNVVLALGKLDQEPFQFRNTKVHFGYVTYF